MILETERLFLIPLSLNQLKKAIVNREEVNLELGLYPKVNSLDKKIARIYNIKIQNIEKDPDNILFYTYWEIVLKPEKRLIGEIGFKGIPNRLGQIEIGYGIEECYRNKGFTTEAVIKLMGWAFFQDIIPVKYVTACTDKENIASQKVLLKAGMRITNEDDKYLF